MSGAALYQSHLRIARHAANRFYLPGADRDDVMQEASIALWEASRTYDPTQGSFLSWARTVVHRHLTGCLRTATSGRQLVLTESARDVDVATQDDTTVAAVIARERLNGVVAAVRHLSPDERATLRRILDANPIDTKQDDNERYRLRNKLKAVA